MNLLVVDTETLGLDIEAHAVWEVGAILITDEGETEYHWFLEVSKHHSDISHSDPIALRIGGFFERHPSFSGKGEITPTSQFAEEFFRISNGVIWVGAVPDFDAYRIAQILRLNSLPAMWNYHLCDVENLVAGKLGILPPWNSKELSEKIGIDTDKYEKHTALGDARWARDLFLAVFNNAQ